MDKCVFCQELLSNGEATSTLGDKGCAGIAKANELRRGNISTVPGQVVHVKCRRYFCSLNYIARDNKDQKDDLATSNSSPCARRSTSMVFNYKENCMFCGDSEKSFRRTIKHKLIPIRTMDFQDNIIQICNERNDLW